MKIKDAYTFSSTPFFQRSGGKKWLEKEKELRKSGCIECVHLSLLKDMFYFLWCLEALNGWHVAFRRGFFPYDQCVMACTKDQIITSYMILSYPGVTTQHAFPSCFRGLHTCFEWGKIFFLHMGFYNKWVFSYELEFLAFRSVEIWSWFRVGKNYLF